MNGWKALGFETYYDFLQSDLWKSKRDIILYKRKNMCEKCRSKNNLNVHHLNYDNVGNEKSDDVMVLCKECHEKEHKRLNEVWNGKQD